MDTNGEFSHGIYGSKFGSWNAAIECAGLKPNRRVNVSKSELIDEIQRLTRELGHTPTQSDMNFIGEFSASMYERRFKTWNIALKEASVEVNARYSISQEELVKEMQRLASQLGHAPTQNDMSHQGEFSVRTYQLHFGGWNAAIEAASLELNRHYDISKQELIDELHQVADKLGRTPAYNDMKVHAKWTTKPYRDRFGTWLRAIETADLEPLQPEAYIPSGEDHPQWVGGSTYNYGPNWSQQRQAAIERDNYQCVECGRTREKQIELRGYDLYVHHKRPLTSFPFIDDEIIVIGMWPTLYRIF